MNTKVLFTALLLNFIFLNISFSDVPFKYQSNGDALLPAKTIFMQANNINAPFRNDGYFNYDKVNFSGGDAGFIWPVGSPSKLTAVFTSGIWIGARVMLSGNNKETRLAASFYNTHFSPGNIPVNGQVPPVSVCNDSAFNGYLVSVTDPSLINGGVRTKQAGGRTYTFNYSPWSAWPVNLGTPYIEVNGIPGYQPGWNSDRPSNGVNNSRPTEMIFVVFMDYTNCTNDIHTSELSLPGGTAPLGVEVQQLAYSYLESGLLNSYFVTYKLINKSGKNWDSTYISLVNDADVGDAQDDAVGCDSTQNIAYTYNFDNNDPMYGNEPPAVGYKIIQGPTVYTGMNTDTAYFPCYYKVGYKMIKMTGHNRFINGGNECTNDPDDFEHAFNYMRGFDGCGNPIINPNTGLPTKFVFHGNGCNTGWLDGVAGDKRNLINTGPFFMNAGDTQIVTYLYDIERGANHNQTICSVIDALNRIDDYYYDCSGTIGIQPVNNNIPVDFSLKQNYPNPFNPVTKIDFAIPLTGNVKIRVYDALGREIIKLVDENLLPGNYSISFNASDYPSGVYFYSLQSEKFIETKKMVIIK